MHLILLIFISTASYAQNYPSHIRLLSGKKLTARVLVRQSRSTGKSGILERIFEQNKKMQALLEQRSEAPVIWDGQKAILTGKTYRGLLTNSIVSTNLASPLIVRANPGQGLPSGVYFNCHGATLHRRVMALCDRMITNNKEVPVSVQILNPDGTAGLLGEYDDGQEDQITGAILGSVSNGLLTAAEGQLPTPQTPGVIGGLISGAKTAADRFTEEMKTKEPIVTINAGKEVLIFFQEALHDY